MPVADERIRREIGSERQELALAVASLRGELQRAKRRLLPKLAAGALVAVTALVVGVKLLRRR